MAISIRRRKKILAEWKAGKFNNAHQIAKKYRIDHKTAKKIIMGVAQTNAHITDALELVENAKRAIKSRVEIQAIEKTVQDRISTMEIDNELIDNNRKLAKLVQKKILQNKDDIDLRSIKNVTGALKDIENIANPQNKTEVNVSQTQEIKVPTITDMYDE